MTLTQKIRYGIIEERYLLDGQVRLSYGIAAYSGDTAAVVASVRDLTSDLAEIAQLAELCNKLELSPIHLECVAEDFIL